MLMVVVVVQLAAAASPPPIRLAWVSFSAVGIEQAKAAIGAVVGISASALLVGISGPEQVTASLVSSQHGVLLGFHGRMP
jgi:hypothetical protein